MKIELKRVHEQPEAIDGKRILGWQAHPGGATLKDEIGKAKATFAYGSKDKIHNAAIVLMDFLKG
ncbi:MAG: hypothetical protein ABIO61_10090 [Thermomonas sp.]